jgi:hypothetical protein
MHTDQTTPIAVRLSLRPLLEPISMAMRGAIEALRDHIVTARQQRIVSQLAPHLRHDVGDIDHRPPLPRPLLEAQQTRRQSLETMRLRGL